MRLPFPAPKRHSASAQALASFWMAAGMPKASERMRTAGEIRRREHHAAPGIQRTAATDADAGDFRGLQAVAFQDGRNAVFQALDGALDVRGGESCLICDAEAGRIFPSEGDGTFGTADVNADVLFHGSLLFCKDKDYLLSPFRL